VLQPKSIMENLNYTLFALINASAHPGAIPFGIAIVFAEYAMWIVPFLIGISWLRGNEPIRQSLLQATASGLAALLMAQLIGLLWQHPRPFMIHMGHAFIAHVADSSFPSDHLTLLWSVAFSLLLHRSTRMAGLTLALLGLPMAWARIYVGVHFPFDMVGAALVAVFSAWLAAQAARWFIPPTYRMATYCHQRLFHPLIQRGWVQR
jgi:undecaprenyl-diphosphatase